MLRNRLLLAILCLMIWTGNPCWGQILLSDGFETGDPLAWSGIVGEGGDASCVSGTSLNSILDGNLTAAPSGTQVELGCIEIRNDLTFERRDEFATSSIPLPRTLGLTTVDGLALIGPDRRRLAAQFEVLSRWGGRVDDLTLPIRWLHVTVEASVSGMDSAVYSLRSYAQVPPVADALALTVTSEGGLHTVDTGLATFVLDPVNPALFDSISVDLDDDGQGRTTVYQHRLGAGPKLMFNPGGGTVTLDTANQRVSVDPDGFELVENGPTRAVVKLDGHFSAPSGASLCSAFGVVPYERFGFTLVATFHRASRGFDLEFHVRNECSDAIGISWTDEAIAVEEASWVWPFEDLAMVSAHYAGSGAVVSTASGFSGQIIVEQRKGAGNPWLRRAQVLLGGVAQESGQALDRPLVAVADAQFLISASMPWMRFREPQALTLDGKTLALKVISEPLVVGEGKGLWNRARVEILPRAQISGSITLRLETLRNTFQARLERGLLPRLPRDRVNQARLFANLGTDASSPIKTVYQQTMDAFHDDTVSSGGQWDRAKTFGSQLWPDVQFDQWSIDAPQNPSQNSGAMNYWNPSGAEMFEYLRTGDPRWVWDFALPQSWLQAFTAYLNIGDQEHGNRSGVAVTSGGTGEGQWHRSSFGSDDYTYNGGLALAYALHPSPALRDRFAQAGRMVVNRYSLPRTDQALRQPFLDQVDITRQVIQHFEMLANCAEFVPGTDGQLCHDRLLQIVDELAIDNLRADLMCQGDLATVGQCQQPQKFMQNALMYPFFHRYLLNYGDPSGRILGALVGDPVNYYQNGLPKLADGVSVDVLGDWASILDCSLGAGEMVVQSCNWLMNSDGNLLGYNKPHSMALLLMAHELDPSLGLCEVAKTALDDPAIVVGWNEFLGNAPGWWKGAAQMMQSMVFGVGIYDVCADP